MSARPITFYANPKDILPDLKEVVTTLGLDWKKLAPNFMEENGKIVISDRNTIHLTNQREVKDWKCKSLSELLRGDVIPPSLEKYPEE